MPRPALVPLIALVLFAGACGSTAPEEVQSDGGLNASGEVTGGYLAAVASETQGSGTGRFEMAVSYIGEIDGTPLDAVLTASGAYDENVPATQMTIDMGGFVQSLTDAAAAAGEDTEGMGELLGDDLTIEAIQVGTMAYLQMPTSGMLGSLLGQSGDAAADQWIALDTSDFGGHDLADLGGTSDLDADLYLDLLQGAYGDVEDLGPVDVRGTETTGYRVQVSVDEALAAQADDEAAAELRSQLELLGAGDLTSLEVPVEVYLDADEQVRRVALDLDVAEMAPLVSDLGMGELGAGASTVSMTIDFFDLGAPVDIQAPPADQIVDLESMFGGLGSMLGEGGPFGEGDPFGEGSPFGEDGAFGEGGPFGPHDDEADDPTS